MTPSRRLILGMGRVALAFQELLTGSNATTNKTSSKGENGMLFHLDFQVEYSAEMSQNDLFTIWKEEAGAALGAKEAGVVVDLWKAVGSRRVIAILSVDSMDMLDQILLDLPIMQKMGQHVQVGVTPLRRYEDFASDVSERVGR